MRQFFYTIEEAVAATEDKPAKKEVRGSFNVDMVTRTVTFEDKLAVLLNDYHEISQQVPIYNKQGKITGMKNQVSPVNSEIFLNQADAARYIALVQIG